MLNFSKFVCHASFSCSNFFHCNLKQNQRKSKTEMTKDGKKKHVDIKSAVMNTKK
jgi:hypothetical protein